MNEFVAYTNKEIVDEFGIEGSKIAYYSNKGIVAPSVHAGKGKGSNRLYSKMDVVKLLLVKELGKHGLSLEQIKKVLADISTEEQDKVLDPAQGKDHIVILGIYDQASDEMRARAVAMPHPEKYPDKFEEFSELEIDLLTHSSAMVMNITPILQEVDSAERVH